MKHYLKYVVKGFKNHLSRFIAVMAIVALGVGVLVGLLSSPSDLYRSLDEYYDKNNFMDVNLKSTIGFNNDSISLLQENGYIVEGYYQEENQSILNDKILNTRLVSIDFSNHIVNLFELIEGRQPLSENECVVISDNGVYAKANINDTISYNGKDYTVVGIIKSPLYISKEKDYNLMGTNRLDLVIYVNSIYQNYTTYTDLYLYSNNLKDINTFDDEYNEKLNEYKDGLMAYEDELLQLQKNQLYSEIYNQVYNNVRDTLLQSYPQEVVEVMLQTDEVKSTIETTTDTNLEQLIKENGYKIYTLDRQSNLGYNTFGQNVNKISKIAVVFPVFFFFIAALVALTTMTRLVEEERSSIGLLKSLGYSKCKISSKYIAYALICSIIGSVSGAALGIFVLPYVIHIAFETLYVMPKCYFEYNVLVNFVSAGIMIITIILVTIYVTLRSLKEKPCQLLMPKAPKPGKRILLEKMPFIWKRLSFKYKNMFRNIFRYKKNVFMMMIGIGGCVMLLICGFGIKDIMGNLGENQYQDVFKYDLKVNVTRNNYINLDVMNEVDKLYVYADDVNLKDDNKYDVTLIKSTPELTNFINFYDKKGNNLDCEVNSVIITKQLADEFDLSIGDTITLDNDNSYIVSSICINYIGNYIYVFEDSISDFNMCYINVNNKDKNEIIDEISSLNIVEAIEVKSQLLDSYEAMAGSLTLVIIVIILCSGALASIVIYNLTNININERTREIATLKVLGYDILEVCGYIYREILVMSLLGILFGFALGPLLFKFIVFNLQSPGIVFSDYIHPLFYLYSFLITLGFVIIVDLLFIPKIHKVKMAESLKCVD